MSLINEALRKTQAKQVQSAPASSVTGQPVTARVQSRHLVQLVLALSCISGLLLGAIGLLIYLFVSRETAAQSPSVIEVAAQAPGPQPVEPSPVQAVAQSGQSVDPSIPLQYEDETEVATFAEASLGPEPTTDSVPAQPIDAGASTEAVEGSSLPAVNSPEVSFDFEAAPQLPSQPVADSTLLAYIQGLQVRGVMAGAGKVLLYLPDENRTASFSAGEDIDLLGRLRLSKIGSSSLTFTDHGGFEYNKRF